MSRNNVISLDSIPELRRLLGKDTAARLAKLGIHSVEELLHHYPRKYVGHGELTPLDQGEHGEYLTYVARLKKREVRRVKSNTLTLIKLTFTDGRSDITCAFFSKSQHRAKPAVRNLKVGESAMITGTVGVRYGTGGLAGRVMERTLIHPEVILLEKPDDPAQEAGTVQATADRPLVIYPSNKDVSTYAIADAVKLVLGPMQAEEISDPVPEQVRRDLGLMPLFDALRQIHFPDTRELAEEAKATLRFHEAFVLQAALATRRKWAESFEATGRPQRAGGVLESFDSRLPFTLTAGQQQVAREIAQDLARDRPMQRLLQGEVGSGKTVVALRAMLQVVDAGGQAALLAPTEVLAGQHLRSIERMLGPLVAEVGLTLLTGSLPAAARKQALLDAVSGAAGIIIGTHALLGEGVHFADLGLVVVDEQHRFGVEQRETLRSKADRAPHNLVMTATPIPRSLAMTVFGDVDTSTLRELPSGRAEVLTHLVPAHNAAWVSRIWERVAEEVAAGGRAYIVCPRIEEDDDPSPGEPDSGEDGAALTSVVALTEELRAEEALAGIPIGIMHGRLDPREKDAAMDDFSAGRTPVLVSTTVIEVGVDVPEATVMVIMDAHMFGLSALHQLRGRIGRGGAPGVCLVVTASTSQTAKRRLEAFAATRDGFELAELDLSLRKEGDVLGKAQSGGASSLRLLRVMEDADLIARAREVAWPIVDADPRLVDHPALARGVERVSDLQEYLDRA